jgi:hypothetical protein
MNRVHTDYLVSSGSFLVGAGSTFALFGNYFAYNLSGTPDAADARGIRQDCAMVGQDIRDVAQKAYDELQMQQLELPLQPK